MVRKILDGVAVLAFLLSAGLAGGSYFGYKYVTSPHGQAKIKKAIMGDLKKMMPSAIDKKLPKMTGPALSL
tara:strand:- start:8303 stop:8515 length:213 start_codon:yes stop_codon:yes gene_type:complete